MLTQFRNPNFYLILLADIFLIIMANIGAYLIRFDFNIPPLFLNQMTAALPLIVIIKVVVFLGLGLYKGMYRYASISDMWRLAKATILSSLLIIVIVLIAYRFAGFSRGIYILDGGLTFLFVGCFRIGIRMAYQEGLLGRQETPAFLTFQKRKGKPVIIIGAGDAGEKTLRELAENPQLKYRVVGFIDDDPQKRGRSIHDVPVLGGLDTLAKHVVENKVEEVLIAVPSATGEQMRRIVDACEECGVRYRTLPGLGELINGKVSVKALRDVDYQDLLGRPPVKLDQEKIQAYLKEKRVLVTGAGGSIGAELCRQIIHFHPENLILYEANEASLYSIQMELMQRASYQRHASILGTVQNKPLLDQVLRRYKPQVVFHAAAYKHVPMLEQNSWQAVKNNILGSQCIMEQCIAHGIDYFVLVSTDKAVRPTNIMGASKRACELIMQSLIGNGTRMMAVRFGNVVGSSGSVIPLFRDQIARGGPVTVTHPEVTRYFMTIAEATQLILQAGALGKGGELFILEMGTPVKIADMARDLIRLSGKDPDKDIEIAFTGLRPGEKLYEELITEGEGIVSTSHEKIMVIGPDGNWNGHGNQEKFKNWLMAEIDELYQLADQHDSCAIKAKLKQIVPEYQPQDAECVL